jgi:hypothetical protein
VERGALQRRKEGGKTEKRRAGEPQANSRRERYPREPQAKLRYTDAGSFLF